MVVYIRELVVRRRRWLDEDTFADGVALCQSIPGAIAMQVAAFVGLTVRGTPGALVAFIGFGLPAFVFMTVLSGLYVRFHAIPEVAALFSGLKVIIVAIIVNAASAFAKGAVKDYRDLLMALCSAILFWQGASPFVVIAAAACAGCLLFRAIRPSGSAGVRNGSPDIRAIALIGTLVLLLMVLLYYTDYGLLRLAAVMLKIDLFAFGGGFASLPLMLHQVVEAGGLIDGKTFMDGVALGQVTPGPIIITATFVGYVLHGSLGALVSAIAIFTPSFLMVLLTAPFFQRLKASRFFLRAVRGILATFVGLLLYVAVKFALSVPLTALSGLLFCASYLALIKKIDILYVVLGGAFLSVLFFR